MSGASDAQNVLYDAVTEALSRVAIASKPVSAARMANMEADDLVPQMRATVAGILACEALAEAAKHAEAACRTALAATMADTGLTSFETEGHTAGLSDAARLAVIDDAKLIPEQFLPAREPLPDRAAIRKALLSGTPVPGAHLSNGGAPTLTIRSRKP